MKKILLILASLTVMATASTRGYFDEQYNTNKIKSYMFGIYAGAEYSDKYEDFIYYGGANTNFMYDIGYRVNVGGKLSISYISEPSYLGNDDWKVEAFPYIGFRATEKTHVYLGYGANGFSELENTFFLFGVDYYFSEDVIFEFNYKRNSEEGLKDFPGYEDENKFIINVVIPFNFY